MKKKLALLFFVSFVVRFLLIFVAYHGDLNNNISWGNLVLQRGPADFYEGKTWPYSAPNQPPLYILLFTFTSYLYQIVDKLTWWLNTNVGIFPSSLVWFWRDHGIVILSKLPSIISDLAVGYLIYHFFVKKRKENLGFRLATLWFINPITWYNSSVWGQTDSIVNLLGLISVFYLLEKKLVYSLLFLVLSLLFKGSLLIFAPIIIFYAIWQKYDLKIWIRAFWVSAVSVILVSVLFHPRVDLPVWLFNLYTNRIFPGEIGYLTANAFNFWWLVNSGRVLDSTVYSGLPAKIWGFGVFIIGTAAILLWLKKSMSDRAIFYSLALTALIAFLFLTRVHERYLYPFFPLGTLLLGFVPGMLFPYMILSITHLLNLYHLFWAPSFSPLEELYKMPWFANLLSLVNILIFFYLLRHLRKASI